MTRDRGRERGGALVVVIAGLALLTALALGASALMRASAGGARDDVEIATARLAAESGFALALAALVDGPEGARHDGEVRTLSHGAARLTIAISDEAGRIDLNAAPPALLAGVFASAGADAGLAQSLAAAIEARRKTARYVHIAELRALPGMTPELFAASAPVLTVHGGTAGIDPRVATEPALRAVPGLDRREIDAYLATRARVGAAAPVSGRAFFVDSPASVYRIAILAELPGGARHRLTTIVRLTQEPRRPYLVVAWE
jgi:general secretion pathway protein K